MLTGALRSQIDRIWNAFWTGGISNPLTVIDQITYLLFLKRLDEIQTTKEAAAFLTGQPVVDPLFGPDQQHLRWSRFKERDPDQLFELFRQAGGVFDFMKSASAGEAFTRFMKGAVFLIPTPRLLAQVVKLLDGIDLTSRDTKGDVYEYLLSKIATAGQNGQFRTPRHIIRMMVELVRPNPDDVVCDPSAGSAGFLVGAASYLVEHHPDLLHDPARRRHYEHEAFLGMEFDATMIRIGAMNLMLHGIENPRLLDVDALSEANAAFANAATLVLANPPFKGSLDHDAVERRLAQAVSTKKTELLFLALILRGLRVGGRAAVIVPDGVLFGSSTAHRQIRRTLVDGHHLEGVISMPSGVFKPYAGVSTAVLLFTKTNSGGTSQVWFYDMKADGYSLDDKRTPFGRWPESDPDALSSEWTDYRAWLASCTHEENNLPDVIARWHHRSAEADRPRTAQSFLVPVADIRANGYDLSINRYKEVVYEQKDHQAPEAILDGIRALDRQRSELLNELEGMLKASAEAAG